MENRDPILLSRFQDETARISSPQMRRQFRLSLALVAILLAAAIGTMLTMPIRSGNAPESAVNTMMQSKAT